MKKHLLRIKKDYFNLINQGIKTLEVRVGYSQIKKIQKGDVISFENYGNNYFDVVRVKVYSEFAEMLDNEDSKLIIPNKTKYQALHMLQEIYPDDKEKLGVYVIELSKSGSKSSNIKIVSASNLAKQNRIAFGKLITEAYEITDYIYKDYPKHFSWYWEKTVPAIFKNTREVIACVVDDKIVGVAFLKKENNEKKICTFLVIEGYRGLGIATKLMEESFKFLETTKPLISLADYKLELFENIIKKYDWKQTQVLPIGYYNNSFAELVYNGEIK